jgi:hypothetical protein
MPSELQFTDGFAVGYSFAVPECFHDALHRNKFSIGDVFYDHRSAYSKPWNDALQHISISLQVTDELGDIVRFSILQPDAAKSQLIRKEERSVSSADFGQILRTGIL